jgi:2-C-methyl-D-erythritol 4-phosphate cytidylyltransferase
MKREVSDEVQAVALIPAAGQGIRVGGDRAKQFLQVGGRPLLALTLAPFQACPDIGAIVVVVPADEIGYCREEIVSRFHLDKVAHVVPGGKRRQDSVWRGLEAAGGQWDLVVIHDGVRPLVEDKLIGRVIRAARDHRCVITGLPATDTVKEVGENGRVVNTYDRGRVWLVQTPQAFRYEDIYIAHRRAQEEGWAGITDDAALVERLGVPVSVIEGSEKNIKVTTPQDLALVRFWMRDRQP